MAKLYYWKIKWGLMTIDEVDEEYREEVKELLES